MQHQLLQKFQNKAIPELQQRVPKSDWYGLQRPEKGIILEAIVVLQKLPGKLHWKKQNARGLRDVENAGERFSWGFTLIDLIVGLESF